VIKGFIEVHNGKDSSNKVLINIHHIVDVRGNIIYMDDTLPNAGDYSCTHCEETYEEIKQKIREAVGDDNA
jgi:hypothetical protein